MGYSAWGRKLSDTTEVAKRIYIYVYLYTYIHIYIYTHHIFFIHSSVDGHLGCFHVLTVENSAAVSIGVHACF